MSNVQRGKNIRNLYTINLIVDKKERDVVVALSESEFQD